MAKDGLDFSLFEVFDGSLLCAAFEGQCQYPLPLGETLGILISQEACPGVQRCEPGVAGGDTVATLLLDERQELGDGFGRKVVKGNLFNGPSGMLGR